MPVVPGQDLTNIGIDIEFHPVFSFLERQMECLVIIDIVYFRQGIDSFSIVKTLFNVGCGFVDFDTPASEENMESQCTCWFLDYSQ